MKIDDLNRARQEALDADEAFQRAVVAQFGASKAGDMRYRSQAHNDATREARQRYHDAAESLRMAKGGN
jgi:hypothetical protein